MMPAPSVRRSNETVRRRTMRRPIAGANIHLADERVGETETERGERAREREGVKRRNVVKTSDACPEYLSSVVLRGGRLKSISTRHRGKLLVEIIIRPKNTPVPDHADVSSFIIRRKNGLMSNNVQQSCESRASRT